MFASAAKVVKSLLDQPIFDLRIPAQLFCQQPVPRSQRALGPAIKQAGSDA